MNNDLISRSALEKYFKDYKWEFVHREDFPKALEMIDCAPAVDAVEVVRCAKCKHYNLQLTGVGAEIMCCTISAEYDPNVGVWDGFVAYPSPDFFCADGERRNDGT